MRRTVGARLRSGLCAAFGTWPLFEVRNKVLHWPGAVRAQLLELGEVRRLHRSVVVPQALVTTVVGTQVRSAPQMNMRRPYRCGPSGVGDFTRGRGRPCG